MPPPARRRALPPDARSFAANTFRLAVTSALSASARAASRCASTWRAARPCAGPRPARRAARARARRHLYGRRVPARKRRGRLDVEGRLETPRRRRLEGVLFRLATFTEKKRILFRLTFHTNVLYISSHRRGDGVFPHERNPLRGVPRRRGATPRVRRDERRSREDDRAHRERRAFETIVFPCDHLLTARPRGDRVPQVRQVFEWADGARSCARRRSRLACLSASSAAAFASSFLVSSSRDTPPSAPCLPFSPGTSRSNTGSSRMNTVASSSGCDSEVSGTGTTPGARRRRIERGDVRGGPAFSDRAHHRARARHLESAASTAFVESAARVSAQQGPSRDGASTRRARASVRRRDGDDASRGLVARVRVRARAARDVALFPRAKFERRARRRLRRRLVPEAVVVGTSGERPPGLGEPRAAAARARATIERCGYVRDDHHGLPDGVRSGVRSAERRPLCLSPTSARTGGLCTAWKRRTRGRSTETRADSRRRLRHGGHALRDRGAVARRCRDRPRGVRDRADVGAAARARRASSSCTGKPGRSTALITSRTKRPRRSLGSSRLRADSRAARAVANVSDKVFAPTLGQGRALSAMASARRRGRASARWSRAAPSTRLRVLSRAVSTNASKTSSKTCAKNGPSDAAGRPGCGTSAFSSPGSPSWSTRRGRTRSAVSNANSSMNASAATAARHSRHLRGRRPPRERHLRARVRVLHGHGDRFRRPLARGSPSFAEFEPPPSKRPAARGPAPRERKTPRVSGEFLRRFLRDEVSFLFLRRRRTLALERCPPHWSLASARSRRSSHARLGALHPTPLRLRLPLRRALPSEFAAQRRGRDSAHRAFRLRAEVRGDGVAQQVDVHRLIARHDHLGDEVELEALVDIDVALGIDSPRSAAPRPTCPRARASALLPPRAFSRAHRVGRLHGRSAPPQSPAPSWARPRARRKARKARAARLAPGRHRRRWRRNVRVGPHRAARGSFSFQRVAPRGLHLVDDVADGDSGAVADAERARGELRSLLRLERAHHRVRLGAVRHGHGVRHEGVVLAATEARACSRRTSPPPWGGSARARRSPSRRVRRLWRTSARSSSRARRKKAPSTWLPMYSLVAAPAGTATVPFRKQSSASPGTARSAASARIGADADGWRRASARAWARPETQTSRSHERDVVRDDARLAVRPGNLRHRREQAVAEQHDVVLRRDEGHLERRPDVARVFGSSSARRTRASRSRARPSPPTPTPTRGRSKWRPCASP